MGASKYSAKPPFVNNTNQQEAKPKTNQPDEQLRRAIEVLKNKDQKTANNAAVGHAA